MARLLPHLLPLQHLRQHLHRLLPLHLHRLLLRLPHQHPHRHLLHLLLLQPPPR